MLPSGCHRPREWAASAGAGAETAIAEVSRAAVPGGARRVDPLARGRRRTHGVASRGPRVGFSARKGSSMNRSRRASRRLVGAAGGVALLASSLVFAGPGALLRAGAVQPRVAASSPACTDTWTNTAGGDWSTASDWSNGVPSSTDVACLTTAGSYTVTISAADGAEDVSSLSLGAGSGTQTLTVGTGASLEVASTTTNGAGGAIDVLGASSPPMTRRSRKVPAPPRGVQSSSPAPTSTSPGRAPRPSTCSAAGRST